VAELPRGRVDPDPVLAPIRIGGRVMNELYSHALQSQPEECCGLISGTKQERYARVHRCRNEMTARHLEDAAAYPRSGTEAYLMNEVDYQRAAQEAEAKGESVTAVYHSHVGAGAYFSELDQEFAEAAFFPFPDASHIVLSVWGRRVSSAGIFERSPLTGQFVGTLVEAGEE